MAPSSCNFNYGVNIAMLHFEEIIYSQGSAKLLGLERIDGGWILDGWRMPTEDCRLKAAD